MVEKTKNSVNVQEVFQVKEESRLANPIYNRRNGLVIIFPQV